MNFTKIIERDKDFVLLQDDGDTNTLIVFVTGKILLNNSTLPVYSEKIEGDNFSVLGNNITISIEGHSFKRIDELVLYLFKNKLKSEKDIVIHLNRDNSDNSADNLKLATVEDLKEGGWEIDESDVQKDLNLLFASPTLKDKYEELKVALATNPYILPRKFVPDKHGPKLRNTTYDGLDVYHASLSRDQRVFYIVRKNSIIVVDIELKGVVQILQAYGHDYGR